MGLANQLAAASAVALQPGSQFAADPDPGLEPQP
jgi:hypothetical protein